MSLIELSWPEPQSAEAWDEAFPGILDNLAIMGGIANVIMQLAHPAVGYGVKESRVDSGSLFKNPAKRSKTTLAYLAVAMLGTTEDKLAYRRAISRVHAQVESLPTSPVQYRALDPDLQMWVAACLCKGYLISYELLRGGMTRDQAKRFYALAAPLGTTLQVRASSWPKTLDEFEEYWESSLDNLTIDDTIRQYLSDIADLKFLSKTRQLFFGRVNRFITIGYLPPKLRHQMHYVWSDGDEWRFRTMMKLMGKVNRIFPRRTRQSQVLANIANFRRRVASNLPLV